MIVVKIFINCFVQSPDDLPPPALASKSFLDQQIVPHETSPLKIVRLHHAEEQPVKFIPKRSISFSAMEEDSAFGSCLGFRDEDDFLMSSWSSVSSSQSAMKSTVVGNRRKISGGPTQVCCSIIVEIFKISHLKTFSGTTHGKLSHVEGQMTSSR